MERKFLSLLCVLIIVSCQQRKDPNGNSMPPLYTAPQKVALNVKEGFRINPFTGDSIKPIGNYFTDTIQTGVPLQIKGKVVSTDTLAPPQQYTIPARNDSGFYTNVRTLSSNPARYTISESDLQQFNPETDTCICPLVATYGDTIPYATPVTLDLTHETWEVPVTSVALPPRMRDNARFNIKYMDLEQGMISLSPLAIMQDNRGSMWISTDDVCEYDGAYFRHFTEHNGTRLTFVQTMMQDSRGYYWFCGARGIYCSDGIQYFKLSAEDGLLYRNDIRTMLEDKDGNIWFGSKDGVVMRYQPSKGNTAATLTHFKLRRNSPEGYVHSSHLDREGNIWFGTSADGVFRFDGTSFTQYNSANGLTDNTVNGICADQSGNLWIGTNAGLTRFIRKPHSPSGVMMHYFIQEGLSHQNIKRILEAEDGTIWMATWGGGINRLILNNEATTETILCEHYTTQDGLTHDVVSAIIEDQAGNIWVGLNGGGVNILKPNSFQHIVDSKELIDLNIRTVFQDKNKNIWFGTEGPNLHMLQPASDNRSPVIQHFELSEGPNLGWTFDILEDSNDDLWFGAREGVWKLDAPIKDNRATLTHYSWWHPFKTAWITSMVEDRNGNYWFATYGGGLIHFKPSHNGSPGTMVHYAEYFGFVCDYITSMELDKNGNLWIATDQNGLCHFVPSADGTEAEATMYTEREGMPSNYVLSLFQDQHSNLWIASNWDGATYFEVPQQGKEGSFTSFTEEQGLSSDQVRSIYCVDKKGNENQVWISTNKGLNLLTRSGDTDHHITSFGTSEGLKMPSFRVSCAHVDDQDHIWWGVENGLEKLNLKSVTISSRIPQPYMRQLDINEKAIGFFSYPDSLRRGLEYEQIVTFENLPVNPSLSYKNNHLTFHFSAIDWSAPNKIQYSYKIDGLNDSWSTPSRDTKAEYRNLPYGTHTFMVSAIGESQQWSEPALYTFTIRPPWWLSWWAYLGYVMIGGSVINQWHRSRLNRKLEIAEKKRLQELDDYKNKLYSNITHEFRSPLTLIHGPVTNALNTGRTLEPKEIASIHRQSARLQQLINQMLDLQKIEAGKMKVYYKHGDIVQHASSIYTMFDSWGRERKINMSLTADPEEMYMDFDEEKLTQIISNLLSNAIKHTPENGKVGVSLQHLPNTNTFQITVQDNGVGISSEDLPYIFDRYYQSSRAAAGGTGIGMALTKSLVDLLKGSITVESQLDVGTTFRVSLPVTKQATYVAPEVIRVPDPIRMESFYEEPAAVLSTGEKANKPIVLVVEDHHEVMQYIASCLADEYSIITASDGVEGLKKAFEYIPDLVISDVMMPRKDGFELCATLKTDIQTSHIPVILLTGRGDHPALMTGIEHGADAYVVKPFDPAELQLRAKKLLELRANLIEHYRQHAITRDVENHLQASPRENEFLKNIRAFVEEHMSDAQFNMDMLCHHMAMSHPQLHRKMTALTGDSTGKFVRSVRLNKAKELLMRSDLTISEIAYETGFSDPGYFTKVFSKEYEMSPSEFRGKGG